MQVKKEKVKEKIVEAAYEIFSKVGYEKASLRQITKKAGTTIGNFYNYFENKEALFDDIVKEAYTSFDEFIKHHQEVGGSELDLMDRVIPMMSPEFLLLIDQSSGTKYEGYKDGLVTFFEQHYIEHVEELLGHTAGVEVTAYASIVSDLFVEGLIKIIREHMGLKSMKDAIDHHFVFFTAGTLGVLEVIR